MRMRDMASVPRVTYALIAINVLVFFTEQGQFSLSGATIHGAVIDKGVLYRFAIAEGHQYWRLISAGFLHENLLHIGFNMYLLYLLGMMLERGIGSVRFAAIYFTSLLAGSFGALFATASPSLGASGAVFGLMGAAVVELRARRMSVMESGIGGLIIINLIFSFTFANISVGAHIGGLIGGALAGLGIRVAEQRGARALGLLACLLLSALAVFGAIEVSSVSGTGLA
ncbi:MAG TPA: rhomboid family intramembrane serine protease [Solirubrobacteraceae bacterium]|jgi:membrane associated rhomboid family serine protease